MKRIDMVGNIYGHLTITEMLYNYNGTHRTYCKCNCDCGTKDIVRPSFDLRNKSTNFTSCGCTNKEKGRKIFGRNIDGQKFGRLLVLETLWEENPPKVKCLCDCGTIGVYRKSDVQKLHTQSCGCYNAEKVTETATKDWAGFISDSGVRAIAPYKQNNKKQWLWRFECPLCNNEFETLPIKVATNHTTSCGCKRESSGERIIKRYLDECNAHYVSQYSFTDCRYKYILKFDFAIFANNRITDLIEYDGIQHFEPVSIFGGVEAYNETKHRDELKNRYCIENEIPLHRFNYKQTSDEIKRELISILNP